MRYCTNASQLPQNGQLCSSRGVVYCEELDECSNLTAQFLCQACPNGLSLCSYTGQCLSDMTQCCQLNEYYCEVLDRCSSVGERCELPNIAPAVESSLIYIDSITDFGKSSSASVGYTIADVLSGNSSFPATDSQGEEVSIAVVGSSTVLPSEGEWQYCICRDLSSNVTCCTRSAEWVRISDVLESHALVLPSTARLRFERRSVEFEGATWLRVKLWDGNQDGYLSPGTDIVQRVRPHFNSTILYSSSGSFSLNTTLLAVLVHPLIRRPEFDSAASFKLSPITEDVPFVYNRGNTISDIVTAVTTHDFPVLPEDRIEGFPSATLGDTMLPYEQLLPEKAGVSYYDAVAWVNPTRKERHLAISLGRYPGVALSFDPAGSYGGYFQVSQHGDERLYIDVNPLITRNGSFLLLTTSARLRFLPSEEFCGTASILLRAWDGFWNETLATVVDNGYLIANTVNGTDMFSEYNLNEWVRTTIDVECILDKPVLQQQELLISPIPYQILHLYERLFTVQIALQADSLRVEESRLVDFLQLILQQDIYIRRITSSADMNRYVHEFTYAIYLV